MRTRKAVRRFDGSKEITLVGPGNSSYSEQSPSEGEPSPVLQIRDIPAHPNNYGDRPPGMPITLIVLHYTATGSLDAAVNWFRKLEAKASAHYLIDRDGAIIRMVPEAKKAFHAGKSTWNGRPDVNRFSIGIELVNWGRLEMRDGKFYVWTKDYSTPYLGNIPLLLEEQWWEPYPEVQIENLRQLIGDIQERNPVEAVVGHRDVAPGRKTDPGPALLRLAYELTL